MNIALYGYGKMGREIEKIAEKRGHTICHTVDKNGRDKRSQNTPDVAIEFSQPDQAWTHIQECLDQNLPVVVGTTGWYDHFDAMVKECKAKNGAVFHATNFSVGVNILFKMNEILANLIGHQPDYQARIQEIHHIHKLDSPSGTGITLAEGLIENHPDYDKWEEVELGKSTNEGVLPIEALRENEVPGIHEITYESEIDYIKLKHSAKSRAGFALGSVLAAEYLAGKKGVYTMNDLLQLNK